MSRTDTKMAIVATLKAEPGRPYVVIAKRFGVHPTLVSKYAKEFGITRVKPEKSNGPPRWAQRIARFDKPTRREGGVMACDEQWAARRHVIGGCS